MRSLRLLLLPLAALFLMGASSPEVKEYILYGTTNGLGGVNTDTLETVSPWIPVKDAKRVRIRIWSAKAAFHASTDADSIYSDTIAVFRVFFSDSMASTNPLIAGDSTIITAATVTNIDTTTKMVVVLHPPLQEALRGPGNGSGIITWVMPVTPGLATADNNGFISPQYMRVAITALRRMTVTGGQSTAGKRIVGLKGLRGRAEVIFER